METLQEIKEKEFYRDKIVEMIENTDSKSTLKYLYFVIKAYTKDRST